MEDLPKETVVATPIPDPTKSGSSKHHGSDKRKVSIRTNHSNRPKASQQTASVPKKIPAYTSGTKDIKHDTFILGPQMGKKWMRSREVFISYAGRTYGGSVKASFLMMNFQISVVKKQKRKHTY